VHCKLSFVDISFHNKKSTLNTGKQQPSFSHITSCFVFICTRNLKLLERELHKQDGEA
jgi:hypothetical protein